MFFSKQINNKLSTTLLGHVIFCLELGFFCLIKKRKATQLRITQLFNYPHSPKGEESFSLTD
jgi:hypothetical protein